ncbi:helix-turn-helix domain-containing protein [Fodinibius halophilus]|uniref:AraC family transcriptional regulator n=1 Tax=Fodinibius halophilus TaxID=1736908 RepID=A0A6M1TML8_9BACT|nr:helix-turn-helix domain-containing protein [Fodinibius halophilus]NGP89630.1 AraC family transcriptional regulator [Fodinibius halophilus]
MQEKKYCYKPIHLKLSLNILKKNLKQITSVQDWARYMGYSRSYFSTSFSEHFGETPYKCLCRVRYTQLHKATLQYPYKTSRAIAAEIGLKDEQALYKFLKRHYETNFTELREKLLYDKEYNN